MDADRPRLARRGAPRRVATHFGAGEGDRSAAAIHPSPASRSSPSPPKCTGQRSALASPNTLRYEPSGTCTGSSGWELTRTGPEDLLELKNFYDYISGGLMIDALDLEPDMIDSQSLNSEYASLGFKRERLIFSLKKKGQLKAIIMAVISDTGLNMSNLTNCMHVFVMNPEDLPFDELVPHLSSLLQYYQEDEIPLLLYPLKYAESRSISYEKIYNLWAINTQYGESYLGYIEDLLHRTLS